ncbi:MAG TPA: hypothetical protein VLK33_11900 [Terriglobales bacterium]|nr:hypothetical protein [Terriglobales bacterium]
MANKSVTYTITVNDKKLKLDFAQAFALADALLEADQPQQAKSIFAALAKVKDRGPRAKLMLAQCEATLRHFQACSEILDATFSDEDGPPEPIAQELQNAFVFNKLGFRDDAIRSMHKLASKFENLPTLCLMLGDMFKEQRKFDKAKACWKLAKKRDLLKGGVAIAADRRLKKLTTVQKNPLVFIPDPKLL